MHGLWGALTNLDVTAHQSLPTEVVSSELFERLKVTLCS